MTSLTSAAEAQAAQVPLPAWEQLFLPFDDVPLSLDGIEIPAFLEPDGLQEQAPDPRYALTLCSPESVEALAMAAVNDDLQRRNHSLVRHLRAPAGRLRRLRPLPNDWRTELHALERSFPHFGEVLSHVRAMGALAELDVGVLRMDALILDGPPGTGKSTFAEHLGCVIAGGVHRVAMGAAEMGGQLGGSAEMWSNSQTGAVFNALVTGTFANPMFVLDELDKATSDPGVRFSPVAPLHELLEPSMARSFRDLSVPALALDASAIVWVATSNDRHLIPAPIQQRLLPFHIQAPAPHEAVRVLRSVMSRLAESEPVFRRFKLGSDAELKLAAMPPRVMRKLLRRACGNAVQRSSWVVQACDVPDAGPKRLPMGFSA